MSNILTGLRGSTSAAEKVASLRWFVFAAILLVVFALTLGSQSHVLRIKDSSFQVSDFTLFISASRAVLFERVPNIYGYEGHTQVLSELFGGPIGTSNPIGLTPIFVLLLAPFATISLVSLTAANSLFLTLSVLLFAGGVCACGRVIRQVASDSQSWFYLLIAAGVFSSAFVVCLGIGQFSIVVVGALLWLLATDLDRSHRLAPWMMYLFISILALKPVYLSVGLILLYASHGFTAFVKSMVFLVLFMIVSTPILGTSWVAEYSSALAIFSSHTQRPEYVGVFAFHNLPLARTALGGMLPIPRIVTVGGLMCGLGTASLMALATLSRNPNTARVILLPILAWYFMTVPYVGRYDTLLFLPAFMAVVIGPHRSEIQRLVQGVVSVVALAILCNFEYIGISPGYVWWIFPVLFVFGVAWWLEESLAVRLVGAPHPKSSDYPK